MRITLVRAAGTAAMLATLLAGGVSAAAPSIETIPIDTTFTPPMLSAACGFPVSRHVVGSLAVRTYVDGADLFVREVDAYRLTETLTANGRSLVGRTVQQVFVKLLPGGGYTVTVDGSDFRVLVPGSGIAFGSVGRLVLVFSASDELVAVAQDVGTVASNVAPICAALS